MKKKVEINKSKRVLLGILGILIIPIFNCSLLLLNFAVNPNNNDGWNDCWKLIIYLYPEQEDLTIKLGYPKSITSSYPKYENEWKVKANPTGDLIDLKTNKKLYSLYYENKQNYNFKIEEDRFIVKGIDIVNFLEEKLTILGLNYKEKEEFIVYWLPKLEKNKYNYIRFATKEEIEKNMPLEISKKPDSLIRILMTYKKLDKRVNIKEQKLNSPKREGFTVVEWGETEI